MIDPEEILRTPRLLLEPLRAEHAGALFPLFRDARLYEFVPQDPPVSEALLAQRYARLQCRSSPDGLEVWLNWALRLRGAGAYVGRAEATVLGGGKALIAYELGVEHWGRGYAAEACGRVVSLLFAGYRVGVIEAQVDTRNGRSIRLLERLGFARVSRRQDADFFKGAPSHEYSYRLEAPVDSVIIRAAGPGDAEEIARVHVASWRAAYRGLVPDSLIEDRTVAKRTLQWREVLSDGRWPMLVMEAAEGTLAGFCHLRASRDADTDPAVTGEITAIYLDPDHWRRGHGRRLGERAIEELRRCGFEEVVLWVLEGNAPARWFCESMGFHLDAPAMRAHEVTRLPLRRYRLGL